jgi:hypothetical protein
MEVEADNYTTIAARSEFPVPDPLTASLLTASLLTQHEEPELHNTNTSLRELAPRGISVPNGVYSHYSLPASSFFRRMKAIIQVPTYTDPTQTYYGPIVAIHIQGREAYSGSGSTEKNHRVGIEIKPSAYNMWTWNAYWANNDPGAGVATENTNISPGQRISVEITWNAASQQYVLLAINIDTGAQKQLIWGTTPCPAVPVYSFRQLIMTSGLNNCDNWNSNVQFVMSNILVETNSGQNPDINSFVYETLGAAGGCTGNTPSRSTAVVNGIRTYTLGK